jgi:hypothetical protein
LPHVPVLQLFFFLYNLSGNAIAVKIKQKGFTTTMLLINPPLFKPCEPPAGIAKLAGCLKRHGVKHTVLDANLEIVLDLLTPNRADIIASESLPDTWTIRAHRNLSKNMQLLTTRRGYENLDRYKRAVWDINRVLQDVIRQPEVQVSLSDYKDQRYSPVSSADIMRAAEEPDKNPLYPYFQKRLLGILEKETPAVAGFSLNYLSQAICTFAMIGFLKRINPRLRIVLGGGLVTSWIRNPSWKNPFKGLVDDLVDGRGEEPLLAILGKTHLGGDDFPDDAVLAGEGYLSPGTILPYAASRGCYWSRCSFCPEKAEKNAWQPEATTSMLSAVRNLVYKTSPVLVHLLDNAISPAHLEAITNNPFGAPWYGFARVSSHLKSPDFCVALRRSGCVMLKIGVESGDQGILDHMGKGFSPEEASTVLKNLTEAGIATYVYLLFGTPAETLEEARKTLAFTVQNSPYIRFLNLAIFNLPAYGKEAQNLQTGDFYEGDLSLYRSFAHPRGWNRNLVREFLGREFRKHPAIASIIQRTPPIFTSNHAPFFCGNAQLS